VIPVSKILLPYSDIDTYLRPLSEGKECTIAQLVLTWTLLQNGVCCVLAGARNKKQVIENWGVMQVPISDEELLHIAEGIKDMERKFER
jgi:aryl-alcohol dehydrogenase-like predicted oxidoreductase